ncbi:MAG: hypothetical protein WBG90_04730 [Saonia sp.]
MMKFVPDKMIKDYNEEVYSILSKVLDIKFKRELKHSGIVLEAIFEMDNLVTNKNSYLLVLSDTSINFSNSDEFIQKFINYLNSNLKRINQDFKELRRMEQEDAIVDEARIFLEDERIGLQGQKYLGLLKKFREIRKVLPDVNN